jgi:hypothetical protein
MAKDIAGELKANREQLAQRRAMSDRFELPRQVDHTAYFRSKAEANRAALTLLGMGYATAVTGSIFKSTLEANKLERLDGVNPDRFVTEVFDVIDANGGTYDGWGGVVRSVAQPSKIDNLASAQTESRPFFERLPEGVSRTPALLKVDYADGTMFAGVSRNPYRRVQSYALHAERRHTHVKAVAVRILSDAELPRRAQFLQALINSLNHGPLPD